MRGQRPIQMVTKVRPGVSVTPVDVVTQRIGVVELFVTRCTRVVMKTDVLGDEQFDDTDSLRDHIHQSH